MENFSKTKMYRVKTHVLSDQSVHITHTYCCVSKLSKFGAYLYSRVHNNTFLSLRNSSEEKILKKFHPPFFLFLAWWPSWLEVGITGQKFGRGPSKDHSTKVWLQLIQWFLRRRFLCEFPIGSYVKLSSVGWSPSKIVTGIQSSR
jgi:hypothetical protein